MSLIKGISGARGTIGGTSGQNLTPIDIVSIIVAFIFVRKRRIGHFSKVVIGRDARLSGEMVDKIVTGTCMSMGVNVVNIGMATTPTTELATLTENADGGIIITASHNPKEWNALKLLNHLGEFVDPDEAQEIFRIADTGTPSFASINELGNLTTQDFTQLHIDRILSLPLVDTDTIRQQHFKVVIDNINSVGSLIVPKLLHNLGVEEIIEINNAPMGVFAHNPEPLPQYLTDLCKKVTDTKADVGFAVDPDVDRLSIVCEDGSFFGEEYTLVSVADYVLANEGGPTVTNLSSSRALKDVSLSLKTNCYVAPVGEVNVVAKMKEVNATIGGEGNGGVIYPKCHYGRDALVGIALFLSYIAKGQYTPSRLRQQYPNYFMKKDKMPLSDNLPFEDIKNTLKSTFKDADFIETDGLKIDLPTGWIHVRKSNTEPILRIYTEAKTEDEAKQLVETVHKQLNCK